MTRPVLVAGIPRSGTTWVARVLSQTVDATYLEEPDNHFRFPYAFRAKYRMRRGEYPRVSVGELPSEYEVLWREAFARAPATLGSWQRARARVACHLLRSASAAEVSAAIARRSSARLKLRAVEQLAIPERTAHSGEHLVVKSVYAPLALEWIAERFEPKVVVVIRHPLNVVSSWRALGWLARAGDDMLDELDPRAKDDLASILGVPAPNREASALTRAAWLAGALTSSLVATAARHPAWNLVSHESLCERPRDGFSQLASALGLRWTDEVGRQVDAMNRPGEGFDIGRVASELPEVWRHRLTTEQAEEALDILRRFPVDGWTSGISR
jgi:Sulfotransferase family